MNVAVKTAGNYKTLRWLSRCGSLRRLSKAVLDNNSRPFTYPLAHFDVSGILETSKYHCTGSPHFDVLRIIKT